MILYGIPNCDTVARARKFLEARNVAYDFHDVRKDGLETQVVQAAYAALGEKTFNMRSPTWRGLSDLEKQQLRAGDDFSAALQNPTVLKRPLVVHDEFITNGFNADDWQALGL